MINLFECGSTNDIDVLVTNIEKATASNGNEYQKLTVRDKDGFTCVVHSFDIILQNTGIIKMTIDTREYNGKKSYKLKNVANSDALFEDFEPKPSYNVDLARKALIKEVWELPNDLAKVASVVLGEVTVNKFCEVPLSDKEYNEPAGLLLATSRLIELVKETARIIPGIDEKIMVAAAILYFVGATQADTFTSKMVSSEMEGLSICISAVKKLKEEREIKLTERVALLLNVLCSAHGMPADDACPEAMALRHLAYVVRKSDEINKTVAFAEPRSFVAGNTDFKCPKYYRRVDVVAPVIEEAVEETAEETTEETAEETTE